MLDSSGAEAGSRLSAESLGALGRNCRGRARVDRAAAADCALLLFMSPSLSLLRSALQRILRNDLLLLLCRLRWFMLCLLSG